MADERRKIDLKKKHIIIMKFFKMGFNGTSTRLRLFNVSRFRK